MIPESASLDDDVAKVAADLLLCLDAQLAKLRNPPKSVSLRTGITVELLMAKARDECCEGVGWVRLVQIYPSSNFPDPDSGYMPCGPAALAAVFELGVARCAPTPDAARIPSGDQWNEVSLAVLEHAAAMRRAICTWSAADSDRMYVPGLWTPLPVEGGCAGGTHQLTIATGACDCDTDEESP